MQPLTTEQRTALQHADAVIVRIYTDDGTYGELDLVKERRVRHTDGFGTTTENVHVTIPLANINVSNYSGGWSGSTATEFQECHWYLPWTFSAVGKTFARHVRTGRHAIGVHLTVCNNSDNHTSVGYVHDAIALTTIDVLNGTVDTYRMDEFFGPDNTARPISTRRKERITT